MVGSVVVRDDCSGVIVVAMGSSSVMSGFGDSSITKLDRSCCVHLTGISWRVTNVFALTTRPVSKFSNITFPGVS